MDAVTEASKKEKPMNSKGVPTGYVKTATGYAHPSRVCAVVADESQQDQRPALEQSAQAREGGKQSLERRGNDKRDALEPTARTANVFIHLHARVKPGKLFDAHDNLRAGMKPLVDAIAASLGVPDNHPGITWEYSQGETKGECGVVVTIGGKR